MRTPGRARRKQREIRDEPTLFGDSRGEQAQPPPGGAPHPVDLFGLTATAAWPDRFGECLRQLVSDMGFRRIRTLSLFSGAGGLDLGFHDAGFEIAEMVELEDRYVATLRHNCGPGKLLSAGIARCVDVRNYHPSIDNRHEFIIGGPPCQTFSAAGRRASGVTGINDRRGTLFEEYVRILKAVRPVGFLFENVYGITGANRGSAWDAIQAGFAAAGYRIFWRILDAADYGVPQHRERMFIVGVREGTFLFPRPTHGPDASSGRDHFAAGIAVDGAAIEPETPRSVGGRFGRLLAQIPPGLNYSFFTENMGHPHPVFAWRSKFSDFLYKADPDAPVRTLKAQGGQYTGPFHWQNRPFSVGELKRLQTIPDSYELVGGRQTAIQMIGNSVPPQVARILALAVRRQVFAESWPFALEWLREDEELGFRRRKRSLTRNYQQKAAAAIADSPNGLREHQPPLRGRCYHVRLTDQFALEPCSPEMASWRVDFRIGSRSWMLRVSAKGRQPARTLRMTVAPVLGRSWALPVERILMRVAVAEDRAFVVAWKAFEAEVVRGGYKADLVQLCNYYQYPATFAASLEIKGDLAGDNWKALTAVCSGKGVAVTARADDLSEVWEIPVSVVSPFVRWLRRLGYEVRNHRTNAEIPTGSYLVPYSFPTLTPQSVQLRKSLD